jgi:hypothetical protein
VATPAERDALRRIGEAAAVARLRMPRSTLARIAGGFSVREGTLLLFRERLRLALCAAMASHPSAPPPAR